MRHMATVEQTVSVGFVGLGWMGRRHAQHVVDLGHEVVGGADVVSSTRERFAGDFDVPVFDGYDGLLDATEPDAVVIATPNAFHAGPTIAALERDTAVLVEKPLSDTLEDAREVAAVAEDAEATAMVGFHNRFSSSMRMLDDYRLSGALGDIVHVEAEYIRRRGIPNVNSWFTDVSLAGGGALIDLGVHTIDFAMAVAGFPEPKSVSGKTVRLYADRPDYVDPEDWSHWGGIGGETIDAEDGATALIRCENDVTISIEIAWARDRPASEDVYIQGTDGGAHCKLGGDTITIYGASGAGTDHYVDSEMVDPSSPPNYKEEMDYFLRTVATGEELVTNTVDEALTVQEIVHGIYESSETGTEYRFDETS